MWITCSKKQVFFNFMGVNNIKQELPINEQIRFREVQVIDEQGQKLGKLPINQALEIAMDKNLDLVLVSANSDNPVCKNNELWKT